MPATTLHGSLGQPASARVESILQPCCVLSNTACPRVWVPPFHHPFPVDYVRIKMRACSLPVFLKALACCF